MSESKPQIFLWNFHWMPWFLLNSEKIYKNLFHFRIFSATAQNSVFNQRLLSRGETFLVLHFLRKCQFIQIKKQGNNEKFEFVTQIYINQCLDFIRFLSQNAIVNKNREVKLVILVSVASSWSFHTLESSLEVPFLWNYSKAQTAMCNHLHWTLCIHKHAAA